MPHITRTVFNGHKRELPGPMRDQVARGERSSGPAPCGLAGCPRACGRRFGLVHIVPYASPLSTLRRAREPGMAAACGPAPASLSAAPRRIGEWYWHQEFRDDRYQW